MPGGSVGLLAVLSLFWVRRYVRGQRSEVALSSREDSLVARAAGDALVVEVFQKRNGVLSRDPHGILELGCACGGPIGKAGAHRMLESGNNLGGEGKLLRDTHRVARFLK